MAPKTWTLAIGALTCLLSAPALAQSSGQWIEINNPEELRALHSNKTINGSLGTGSSYVAYYRPNGEALLIWKKERIPQTWVVKGNDQVCYSDKQFGARCYRFRRHKERRDDIVMERVSDNALSFPKIEEGIPRF